MKISFHGAAQTVTGSKHLIETEHGEKILMDCGMFQGLGKDTYEMNTHFGFDPKQVDHLILSHAHIDHSGLIPRLVKEGFNGKIYATPATYDICKVMLPDSAYIVQQDVKYVNKRKKRQGKPLLEPLYDIEHVDKAIDLFETLPFDKEIKISDFTKLMFTNSGHILGAGAVNLQILEGSRQRRVCFTGDIGRYDTALLKNPNHFPQADIVLCESTYGNRTHESVEHAAQAIMEAVVHTVGKKKGRLIIPAFSLGRTQEVVYALNKLDLHGLIPDVRMYVDSPLSVSATDIMRKHVKSLNRKIQRFMEGRPDPFGFDDMQYVRSVKDSKMLNELDVPCIIISASGMAEAGRVKHHIKHALGDEKNTILMVGYAAPSSLGGKLRNGDKEVTIFGDLYPVKCEVRTISGLSAHGDYEEMMRYLSCQDKSKIEKLFLVHGEEDVQKDWKQTLYDEGYRNIYVPFLHESFRV